MFTLPGRIQLVSPERCAVLSPGPAGGWRGRKRLCLCLGVCLSPYESCTFCFSLGLRQSVTHTRGPQMHVSGPNSGEPSRSHSSFL